MSTFVLGWSDIVRARQQPIDFLPIRICTMELVIIHEIFKKNWTRGPALTKVEDSS